MRRFFWAALILALISGAFALGRGGVGVRALPAIVETLPGDEADFSREFDTRVRERFPIGSSEDKLLDFLQNQQFLPEWRRRDDANSSSYVAKGLICQRVAHVRWRADAAGSLLEIGGAYESHCN